jgi:hypothetical protein
LKPTLASAGIDKPCESLSGMLRHRECCDDGTPLPAPQVRRGTRSEAGSAVLHVRDANGQALAFVYFEDEPGPTRGFGHSIQSRRSGSTTVSTRVRRSGSAL